MSSIGFFALPIRRSALPVLPALPETRHPAQARIFELKPGTASLRVPRQEASPAGQPAQAKRPVIGWPLSATVNGRMLGLNVT